MDNPLEIGGVLAVCMGLVRLVESLIGGLVAARKERTLPADTHICNLNETERDALCETAKALADIHQMLSRTDSNGLPLVYAPRAWGDTLQRIEDMLRDLYVSNQHTAVLDERQTKLIRDGLILLADLKTAKNTDDI